jgi:hypothetical protein
MATLEEQLRALCMKAWDEYEPYPSPAQNERWMMRALHRAFSLGESAGYERGVREVHAVALKLAADLVKMGCEENCPGQREHIDREEVVERVMRFKRDIDAIRALAAQRKEEGK